MPRKALIDALVPAPCDRSRYRQAKSQEKRKHHYQLQATGINMDKIAQRVIVKPGMKCEQVRQKGKNPHAAKASSLICYRAVREPGISATALAGTIAISKPAVRQRAKRCEDIAKENGFD